MCEIKDRDCVKTPNSDRPAKVIGVQWGMVKARAIRGTPYSIRGGLLRFPKISKVPRFSTQVGGRILPGAPVKKRLAIIANPFLSS